LPSGSGGTWRSNGLLVSAVNEQEADEMIAERAECARHETLRQLVAERGQRHRPQRQDQHPQQQRALVRAPHGADAVFGRQLQVGILRHVGDREILVDEAQREDGVGRRKEHELAVGGGTRHPHQRGVIELGADQRYEGLHRSEQQRKDQEDLAQLRHHGVCAPWLSFCALPLAIASATSLGM
jgi:hypothetical protein